MDLLKKLSYLFDRRQKLHIAVLLALMLVGALLETIGVGLIMPFVGVISDPRIAEKHKAFEWLRGVSGSETHEQFIVSCGLCLVSFYVVKNSLLSTLIYLQNHFVFNKQISLSRVLLNTYFDRPYTFHIQRNSAELQRNLLNVATVLTGVFLPFATIIPELMVVGLITSMLFATEPLPAVLSLGALGAATITFYYVVRRKLKRLGEGQHYFSEQIIKWINQGIGGIKEIKVLGRSRFFIDEYVRNVREAARITRYSQTVTQLPRLFVETIAVCGIVLIVAAVLWEKKDIGALLPVLGLFALATVRLMPSMSRIVGNMSVIRMYKPLVDCLYFDIRDGSYERAKSAPAGAASARIGVRESIELRSVSYRYPNAASAAVEDVSAVLKRGQSVALVGPSGAGKTTLVDLILGLLEPSGGVILVDGKDIRTDVEGWQRNIGYVPQAIYLSDDSIRRNIAFGIPDAYIEEEKVKTAMRAAQLGELVSKLPQGLDTFVGERGFRLSGGQRQRIGIARALYANPDVLIFDEATSALDSETEEAVAEAIERLSGEKFVIVIAHRMSTARICKRLVRLVGGKVISTGSYQEVIGSA